MNKRSVRSYNDNSGAIERLKCLKDLEAKKSIAYCCDSGTPLISDPGYKLVREVIERGYKVRSIPGASSILTALCQSGLPSDHFCFVGFPPSRQKQRIIFFRKFSFVPATLIFFESPKRIIKTLEDLQEIFGESHFIVICRELTKRYEDNKRGTIKELINEYKKDINLRGEFTILVNKKTSIEVDESLIISELSLALKKFSLKDSVVKIADKYSLSKKKIYKLGLKILKN